jgi:hypothetical protein
MYQHDRVFTAGEKKNRSFKLGGDFTQYIDGFRFKLPEMG